MLQARPGVRFDVGPAAGLVYSLHVVRVAIWSRFDLGGLGRLAGSLTGRVTCGPGKTPKRGCAACARVHYSCATAPYRSPVSDLDRRWGWYGSHLFF